MIEQWADITLAARERQGESFYTNSPQAYFIDNLKAAKASRRTPPDWWHELRKQELARQREQEHGLAHVLRARNVARIVTREEQSSCRNVECLRGSSRSRPCR